jgi:hypothetical protein
VHRLPTLRHGRALMTIEPLLRRTFTAHGAEYMKPCFTFAAYWVGSAFDRASALVGSYRRCLTLLGTPPRFYETDTSGGARPVDDETLDLVPFWFAETRLRRSIYFLSLESGAAPDLPSDRAFHLRAWEATDPPVGCLRLMLPVDYAEEAGDGAVATFADLVSGLAYSSGYAGFAMNWNETGDHGVYAQRKMGALARRHPGLELPDTTATLAAIPRGFKRVNWLTLLDAAQRDRLGGTAVLRRELGPEITVHELPDGVIVQAGPRPDVGDVNRHRWLPLYHRVGAVLEPARAREHPAFIARGASLGDEDLTEEWLAHFDNWPPDVPEPWTSGDEWRADNDDEDPE